MREEDEILGNGGRVMECMEHDNKQGVATGAGG